MKNKRKSIVIDGRNLALEEGTGISTYARNLSYSLHDMNYHVNILYGKSGISRKSELINEISFFDIPKNKSAFFNNIAIATRVLTTPFGHKAVKIPITGKVILTNQKNRLPYFDNLWNSPWLFQVAQVYFSLYKTFYPVHIPGNPDIAHWTFPTPIWAVGAKNIYTLHDIVPLRLPYTTLDNKVKYLKLIMTIIKKAHHICTVSETTKQDLMNILNTPNEHITNTYQAVNIPEEYLSCDIEYVKSDINGSYNLEYKEYFLFFGAIEPKKNVGRIIEAYLTANIETPLILAGGNGWMTDLELRMIVDNHISSIVKTGNVTRVKKKIMRIDYAPFRLLVSLIRGAKATIFPSIYEGFGLPILESMLCGTPVITSNIGAMKEIANDAALCVDPYNVREIRDAIIQLDSNPELCAELSKKGVIRAEYFNQLRYQERLNNMYKIII